MTEGRTGDTGSFRDRIVDDYSGYKVNDRDGEKLGKVEYTVLDESEQPEYIGLKTGFFGSKATLVPESLLRLNDSNEFEVDATERQVNDAPTVGDEDEISPDFESRILEHYGLGRGGGQDSYGSGSSEAAGSSSTGGGDRGYDREDQDSRSESRDDDRNRDRNQDSDYGRGGEQDRSGSSTGGAAAAGGLAAGASSGSGDRDQDRDDHGTEYRKAGDVERQDSRSGSRRGSDEGGEKIRVTLKREEARAERIIDEDGEEEVRIRKRTVKEETLVDVEDMQGDRDSR